MTLDKKQMIQLIILIFLVGVVSAIAMHYYDLSQFNKRHHIEDWLLEYVTMPHLELPITPDEIVYFLFRHEAGIEDSSIAAISVTVTHIILTALSTLVL
jgi:hypothetical protein